MLSSFTTAIAELNKDLDELKNIISYDEIIKVKSLRDLMEKEKRESCQSNYFLKSKGLAIQNVIFKISNNINILGLELLKNLDVENVNYICELSRIFPFPKLANAVEKYITEALMSEVTGHSYPEPTAIPVSGGSGAGTGAASGSISSVSIDSAGSGGCVSVMPLTFLSETLRLSETTKGKSKDGPSLGYTSIQ